MRFKVENGSDHISIEVGNRGDYFRFDHPLSVTWPYNGGTVGTYFCVLPYSSEYREELRKRIMDNLNRDFTNKVEELYDLLLPLFSLFKNGEYTLSYYNNEEKEFFRFKSSLDKFTKWQYRPVQINFGDEVDVKQIESIKEHYADFVKENEVTKKYATSDIFEFTTCWLYDGSDEFYATQPYSVINQERVDYFEKRITAGARPLVIVMNADQEGSNYSSQYYVIDGHHKLLAYQKLAIHPPLAVITYHRNTIPANDYDIEKLFTMLYPWQVRKILDSWDKRDMDLAENLKNPYSTLHQFIRQGWVKEHYENKKLKSKIFYINDQPDGKWQEWYDNGRLMLERYYVKGLRVGTWKEFYPSGKVKNVQSFNEKGLLHGDAIHYYENGQKLRITKWENGWHVDGLSHQAWNESSKMTFEQRYENRRMIEQKRWDETGRLVYHQIYDAEQEKYIQQLVPVYGPLKLKTFAPEKDLGIIRERQYPKTNNRRILQVVVLMLLMLIALLRMCS